jgi:PAS domain S-box-containing protein
MSDVRRAPAPANIYDGVFEHAPCGVLLVDRAGRIVRANARAARDFGYEPAELVGQPVEILIPEQLRRAHGEHRDAFAARAHAYRALHDGRTLRAQRKDGTVMFAEIGLTSVDGELVAAFVVDVSEREERERALRASEARYRALFEHAGGAILVVDADAAVRDCNHSATMRLGVDRVHMLGASLDSLLALDGSDAARALVRCALENGIARATRVALRRDGEREMVDVSASPIQSKDGPLALVVLEDVTPRERGEQEKRPLRGVNGATSLHAMAANVAREIAHPLTDLFVSLDAVEVETVHAANGTGDDACLGQAIRDARDAAERLRSVEQDLRWLGRPDEERRHEGATPFSGTIVDDADARATRADGPTRS